MHIFFNSFLLMVLVLGACDKGTKTSGGSTQHITNSPTPTPSPTSSPSPNASASPSPSPSSVPLPTPTPVPTPIPTPTPRPTPTPIPTPTPLPSPTSGTLLPADRNYAWSGNVGVPGGIPNNISNPKLLTPSPTGNDKTQIQDSLKSAPVNGVVLLSPGVFNVSGWYGIDWQGVNPGVVLRGSGSRGANQTTILLDGMIVMRANHFNDDYGQICHQKTAADPCEYYVVNLSADAVKDSHTLQLESVPPWILVGGIYLLDQLDDPSLVTRGKASIFENGVSDRERVGMGSRGLAQRVKVIAKTSTTVTLEMPIAYPFKKEFSAQLSNGGFQLYNGTNQPGSFLTNAGIENLKIVGSKESVNAHTIKMEGCDGCWIRNVESEMVQGLDHVMMFDTYRCEVRDSYFHDSFYYGAGQGYGVAIYNNSSGVLVENNILEGLHSFLQINFGSSANVIAYNYALKGKADAKVSPCIVYHGTHSYMNLAEGNYCEDKIEGDIVHGSGSHLVIFRNRILGISTYAMDETTIEADYYNRKFSAIGNVLGFVNPSTGVPLHRTYEFVAPDGCYSDLNASSNATLENTKGIFKLGYRNPFGCATSCVGGGNCFDLPAVTDIFRALNYDVVSGFVSGGHTIAELSNSLYLSAKPSWFGSSAWPPFTPNQSSLNATNPAKTCRDAGKMPNCLAP
jgi:hypothetical protein